MDLNDMAGKAQEFAKDHPEQVEGACAKAPGEFGRIRYAGHDEQFDRRRQVQGLGARRRGRRGTLPPAPRIALPRSTSLDYGDAS